MYVCQQCSRISNPGESANFVVTKTRQKTYSDNGQITYGFETVKEEKWCKTCFKEHKL